MATIGPGPNDPEYDNYDSNWRTQETPFREWLRDHTAAAGHDSDTAAYIASSYAPANRYHGLTDDDLLLLAALTGTTTTTVRAMHKADLDDMAWEQELRAHPDLAVLDADLNRIRTGRR